MAASDAFARNLYSDAATAPPKESRLPSKSAFLRMMILAEMGADCLASAGIVAALLLVSPFDRGHAVHGPVHLVFAGSILAALVTVFLLHADGAYCGDGSPLQIRETARMLRTSAQLVVLMTVAALLFGTHSSHVPLAFAAVLIPLVLVLEKHAVLAVIRMLRHRGHGVEPVVVWGTGDSGRRAASSLLYSPRLGLRPVAVIEDDPVIDGDRLFGLGYRRSRPIPVLRAPITAALLKSWECNTLVVAAESRLSRAFAPAIAAAHSAGMRVALIQDSALPARRRAELLNLQGMRSATMSSLDEPRYHTIAKRVVDLAFSAVILIGLAPLLLLIALLVRLDSPGPALFVQKRVGVHGTLFDMFKFRTMHIGVAEYDPSPTMATDRRITRIGRLLRRTSLDELPQFVNVLIGNMSLVGPRPEMPFIVDRYDAFHRQRLQVIPGITGLWQLSAHRTSPIHENILYDLYYIRNRTFFMDAAILAHTLFFAMRGV